MDIWVNHHSFQIGKVQIGSTISMSTASSVSVARSALSTDISSFDFCSSLKFRAYIRRYAYAPDPSINLHSIFQKEGQFFATGQSSQEELQPDHFGFSCGTRGSAIYEKELGLNCGSGMKIKERKEVNKHEPRRIYR